MHPSTSRHIGAAALTGLAIILAACGSSGATSNPTLSPVGTAAAATTAPASTTVAAASIDVTLQEWAVVPSATTLKAGSVTFNAKNVGPKEMHEMVVFKTDLGLLNLPTGADGKVDEAGAGLEVMGEIAELAVGASGSMTLDLAAGRYLLICNIVGADGTAHYGKGMTTEITVQ